jgi:VanZ family protein
VTSSDNNTSQVDTRRLRWAAVAMLGLVILAFVVPLPKLVRNTEAPGYVVHVAAFGILAALCYRLFGKVGSMPTIVGMLACWTLMSGLGLATEGLQSAIGRTPSWEDAWANTCGACGGILWMWGSELQSRRLRAAICVAACLILLAGIVGPFAVRAT